MAENFWDPRCTSITGSAYRFTWRDCCLRRALMRCLDEEKYDQATSIEGYLSAFCDRDRNGLRAHLLGNDCDAPAESLIPVACRDWHHSSIGAGICAGTPFVLSRGRHLSLHGQRDAVRFSSDKPVECRPGFLQRHQ